MKTLIIGGLLIFTMGVGYVALQPEDVVPVVDIQDVVFEDVNPKVARENISFASTTDEDGNKVRTGIKIPISYEFPVATSTGFIIEEREEFIEMNLGAYNKCRQSKTKPQCVQELKSDINQTVDAYEQNIKRDLEELKVSQYMDELNLTDL